MIKEEGIVMLEHSPRDYSIATSACTIALVMPVVIVADDTDILILLRHHFTCTGHRT